MNTENQKIKFVSYLRVSTKKQGVDGLGVSSQRIDITKYLNNANGLLISEFVETESGTKTNRKELEKALKHCKDNNANLIVSRLDRLTRNSKFLFTLLESKVNIVFADMPNIDITLLKILSIIAEKEVQKIRENTKKALNAKKLRGEKLGIDKETLKKYSYLGGLSMKENALNCQHNQRAYAMIKALKQQSLSFRQIAKELNTSGFRTKSNTLYSVSQIIRIYNTFQGKAMQSIETNKKAS